MSRRLDWFSTQTGFILIIVLPAILQLFLFVAFLQLLEQTEIDRQRVEHARSIMMRMTEVIRLTNRVTSSILFNLGGTVPLPGGKSSAEQRQEFMVSTREHLRTLEKLADRGNRAEYKLIRGLPPIIESIFVCIDQANSPGIVWDDMTNLMKKGAELSKEFNARSTRLLKLESEIQSRVGSEQSVRVTVLGVAVALNFLLTLVTGRYFARRVIQRLNRIGENSVRLAAGIELLPPLSGRDEIAQLDLVLHDSARALEEAARKERELTENVNDIVCSLDEKGRFRLVNPAALAKWGYGSDDLMGRSLVDLVVTGDKKTVNSEIEALKESGSPSVIFETRIREKDGGIGHYLWSVNYSREDRTYFCVAHDITDKKELEEMRQRFLATVSEDLRTPLTSILTQLNAVTTGECGEIDEKAEKHLLRAEKNMDTLIELVDDLLDVEMLAAGRMPMSLKPVPIALVIETSVEMVAGLAASASINMERPSTAASVYGDADRLTQVLVNLLSNAIKFSPEGSLVSIEVDDELDEDFVKVTVTDSGCGIADEDQIKVFDQYRQAGAEINMRKPGSGIGLAICKAIVEQHAGSISVDSVVGKGSSFSFLIPRKAGYASEI